MTIQEKAAEAIQNDSLQLIKICIGLLDKYQDDYRDVITGIAIIYDALIRLNVSPDDFLKENANLVSDQAKVEIYDFLNRSEQDKKLDAFGYIFQQIPNCIYLQK